MLSKIEYIEIDGMGSKFITKTYGTKTYGGSFQGRLSRLPDGKWKGSIVHEDPSQSTSHTFYSMVEARSYVNNEIRNRLASF